MEWKKYWAKAKEAFCKVFGHKWKTGNLSYLRPSIGVVTVKEVSQRCARCRTAGSCERLGVMQQLTAWKNGWVELDDTEMGDVDVSLAISTGNKGK